MAATVSGSRTVSQAVAPHRSASTLTTRLSTTIENLTVGPFSQIQDALSRIPNVAPTSVSGSLLIFNNLLFFSSILEIAQAMIDINFKKLWKFIFKFSSTVG